MTFKERTLLVAAFSACVIAVNFAALRALIRLSSHDATASHHVLAPLISIALIYWRRAAIFQQVKTDARPGILIILAGMTLSLLGGARADDAILRDVLSLKVAGVVVQVVGGFVLLYGRAAARVAMFPLMFLGFLVPIPSTVLAAATLFLKSGSAEAVAGLFTLVGTPFHRDGFVFSLSTFVIEIADNCSGIRSSIALLLTGVLAGHLFLSTRWRKAILLIAILPIAVVKNAIRIVSLSLLAVHVDQGFLNGELHHEGGVVFFVLALAILTPLLTILRNSEPATSSTSN